MLMNKIKDKLNEVVFLIALIVQNILMNMIMLALERCFINNLFQSQIIGVEHEGVPDRTK